MLQGDLRKNNTTYFINIQYLFYTGNMLLAGFTTEMVILHKYVYLLLLLFLLS